jgi:hypothetical protein
LTCGDLVLVSFTQGRSCVDVRLSSRDGWKREGGHMVPHSPACRRVVAKGQARIAVVRMAQTDILSAIPQSMHTCLLCATRIVCEFGRLKLCIEVEPKDKVEPSIPPIMTSTGSGGISIGRYFLRFNFSTFELSTCFAAFSEFSHAIVRFLYQIHYERSSFTEQCLKVISLEVHDIDCSKPRNQLIDSLELSMDEALFPQEEVIMAINGGHCPMLTVIPPLSKYAKKFQPPLPRTGLDSRCEPGVSTRYRHYLGAQHSLVSTPNQLYCKLVPEH